MIIGRAIIVSPPPINADKILNNNTWEVIKQVSDRKQGQNFWAVGDCKQITMNGRISDILTLTNYTAWVYIIGFNHNAEREGNGITFQGFKATDKGAPVCLVDSQYDKNEKITDLIFVMNATPTNATGWTSCQMRQNIMPLIKTAFPADLQAVIKPSTIFTKQSSGDDACTATEDEVFLLAEYEIFGTRHYASTDEANCLKQYTYYSAGNSKVKYKHNATSSAATWWERSPRTGNSSYFCAVSTGGSADTRYATFSYGVSPCFKV